MSYRVVTSFNTVSRRFAVGQIVMEHEDLGGAVLADVLHFLEPIETPPAEPGL